MCLLDAEDTAIKYCLKLRNYPYKEQVSMSDLPPDSMTETPINYDRLMQANLTRVFNERDPQRRIEAIRELYTEAPVLYEPHAAISGHAGISDAVSKLHSSFPPHFRFSSISPADGHHNVGRLNWCSGPSHGPAAITGLDIAHFEKGRIQSLYVFLNPHES